MTPLSPIGALEEDIYPLSYLITLSYPSVYPLPAGAKNRCLTPHSYLITSTLPRPSTCLSHYPTICLSLARRSEGRRP